MLLVPFSSMVKRHLYSDPDINSEVMYNAVRHLCLVFKEITAVRTHRAEHLCISSFSLPLWEPPFQWSHCRFSLLSMSAFGVISFSWSPHRPTRTQCSLHKTQTLKKLGKQQDHLRKEKIPSINYFRNFDFTYGHVISASTRMFCCRSIFFSSHDNKKIP